MAEPVPQTALELRNWLYGLKEQSGASYDDIARGIGEDSRAGRLDLPRERKSGLGADGCVDARRQ